MLKLKGWSSFLCFNSLYDCYMRYDKPFQTVSQQLAILKSRGLIISDDAKAKAYLERIGYYRLSGYWHPFRASVGPTTGQVAYDNFKPNIEFRHIIELYVFDKKLRLAMLDAIERVEVGLRTSVALIIGQKGAWAHRNPSQLDGKFSKRAHSKTGKTPHQEWLEKLDASFERSKEEFSKHFKQKYPDDQLPIWIAIELWDFGMLSHFYAGMLYADRKALAVEYGLNDPNIMESWLRAINLIRNLCAHHSRLWNRPLVLQCKFPSLGKLPLLDHLTTVPSAQTRLYGTAAAIRFLLLKINPATSWPNRLKDILDSFPAAPDIALSQTGFPDNWHSLPLWSIPDNVRCLGPF